MEECAHRIWMPLLSVKLNRSITHRIWMPLLSVKLNRSITHRIWMLSVKTKQEHNSKMEKVAKSVL
jgi:uncharacterized protein YecE (DUF72 family)